METGHLFCCANQLTGFYMMATLAFNEFPVNIAKSLRTSIL